MDGPGRPGWSAAGLLAYVGGWALFALLVSSQSAIVYAATGGTVQFGVILKVNAMTAFAWGLVGVVALWAAGRFPIDRGTWKRALPIHLALMLLLWIAAQGIVAALRSALGPPILSGFVRQLLGSINLAVVVYTVLVLIVHIREYRRGLREHELRASRAEAKLASARLDALRAQLHPHFLFNTMHAISALVRDDPRAAEDMLAELAELLRVTIDGAGEEEVTLGAELDFIDRYLQIQRARFRDRLELRYDIEDGVASAAVPALLLQPLVENAVEHGVARSRAGGTVTIAARRNGERLSVAVLNDGPAVDRTRVEPSEWGVGLRNVAERLAVHFGEDQKIEVACRPEGGVAVELDLPLRPIHGPAGLRVAPTGTPP